MPLVLSWGLLSVGMSFASVHAMAQYFSNKVPEASYRHLMQPEPSNANVEPSKRVPTFSTMVKGKRIEPCWADRALFGLGCPGPMVTRPSAALLVAPSEWRTLPDGSRCIGTGCDQ